MAKSGKSTDKVIDSLRHAEYYGMQEVFDKIYDDAINGKKFTNLMELILSESNIMLAYRNIKQNKGSYTPGTDGRTIKDLQGLTCEEIVAEVRNQINTKQGYHPKAVRRKNIPKPNGNTRPLGIPCIWDRLIQQCIKQVMDPICEAKFNDHSYGFRTGRSAEQAIAEMHKHMTLTHCYYFIEFDIKGFFDNVDHRKLKKQIWSLGIQDKKLLYIIGQILNAPIKLENGKVITPQKGTPQGGILSPLLANIVLNELDWWICSQWEDNPVVHKYKHQAHKNGSPNKGHGYRAMRDTKLKEMYIIRYADDFRIACRDKGTAEKIYYAVTDWLNKRLKLEISPEKTRIVFVKKQYTEFLGFKMKVHEKAGKFVTESHMSDKRKEQITDALKEQAKRLRTPRDDKDLITELRKYNSIVMGVHNYFKIATHVNIDCQEIAFKVNKVLENRLKSRGAGSRLRKSGKELSPYERKTYGKSKQLRYEKRTGFLIYPIGYVQHYKPINRKYGQTPYTEKGRELIHNNLEGINMKIMHKLMQQKVYGSIEYADNRLSLYSAQQGKCAITGKIFESTDEIHCHHKVPKEFGGDDSYQNLMLINKTVHKLVHARREETIQKYLSELNLNKTQKEKLNKLRVLAKLSEI